MKKNGRIILAVATFIVASIAFIILGSVLYHADIHGPFIGDDYLTEWSNWKYVVFFLSLAVTLLVYQLTAPRTSSRSSSTS